MVVGVPSHGNKVGLESLPTPFCPYHFADLLSPLCPEGKYGESSTDGFNPEDEPPVTPSERGYLQVRHQQELMCTPRLALFYRPVVSWPHQEPELPIGTQDRRAHTCTDTQIHTHIHNSFLFVTGVNFPWLKIHEIYKQIFEILWNWK